MFFTNLSLALGNEHSKIISLLRFYSRQLKISLQRSAFIPHMTSEQACFWSPPYMWYIFPLFFKTIPTQMSWPLLRPQEYSHVCQHKVLQAGCTARTARLIIVLESLKEVSVSLLKLPLPEMHLPTTLCKIQQCQRWWLTLPSMSS